MAAEREFLESYQVGEKFRSPQRTVTESDIVSFCSLTGDWHPLHSDVEYAGKTVFGERIAHGWLVLSLGVSLAFRLGENIFLPKSFIANYGVDNLRFTKPVKIGDTIRGEWEVTDLTIKDQNRGILTYRYQVKNQRDEVVADMILKTLCGRRGSAS